MNTNVCVERGAAVERLATGLTLVRLLLRVDDLMAAESARLPEAFAAYLNPRPVKHIANVLIRLEIKRHAPRTKSRQPKLNRLTPLHYCIRQVNCDKRKESLI
jgi:hypothetical protein